MTFHEIQEQALKLSIEERWQLVEALMRSLQPHLEPTPKPEGLAASLIGIAKTDTPPPTDEEVKAMLDERSDSFLLAISGIGDSDRSDISERNI